MGESIVPRSVEQDLPLPREESAKENCNSFLALKGMDFKGRLPLGSCTEASWLF